MDSLIYTVLGVSLLIWYQRKTRPTQGCGRHTSYASYRDYGTQTDDEIAMDTPEDQQSVPGDDGCEMCMTSHDDQSQSEHFDDNQALRDQAYIDFVQATDDDFTAGPARFVAASDGVQECAALLMPITLVVEIREAIEQQRVYAQQVQITAQEQMSLQQLESKVKLEIANHEHRIEQMAGSCIEESTASLQDKLDSLRLMLDDIKFRQETVEQQMLTDAMILRNYQASVTATLEESFLAAALVDPHEDEQIPEQQELDLQAEYLSFRQRQQELGEEPQNIEPLEDSGDDVYETGNDHLGPQEIAEHSARNNFYAAREKLAEAQVRFERREIDREIDRQTTTQDTEEFDVRWVRRFRELTSQLIDAEAAFKAARVAAHEGGVDIAGEDACSLFVDREDDGYRESHDAACTASVPRDKIVQWIESIPEDANPDETCVDMEVDDWDAEEVDMSDSISCVGVGSYRTKIDHWQQGAGA